MFRRRPLLCIRAGGVGPGGVVDSSSSMLRSHTTTRRWCSTSSSQPSASTPPTPSAPSSSTSSAASGGAADEPAATSSSGFFSKRRVRQLGTATALCSCYYWRAILFPSYCGHPATRAALPRGFTPTGQPSRRTPLYVTGTDLLPSELIPENVPTLVFHLHALWRGAVLLTRMLPVVLRYVFAIAFSRSSESRTRRLDSAHRSFAGALASLGPTYIKLGQWIAMRGDLFPPAMYNALAHLFDSGPEHAWKHTQRVLDGAGMVDAFDAIDEQPLNSGSIAQVHRGKLRKAYHSVEFTPEGSRVETLPAGTEVILKVRHPGIVPMMLADLKAMAWGASFAQLFIPSLRFLWPERTIAEFSGMLLSQVDLEREADNLNDFRFHFRDCDQTIFPTPLLGLSSKEMLVETYEWGVRIPMLGKIIERDAAADHQTSDVLQSTTDATTPAETPTTTIASTALKQSSQSISDPDAMVVAPELGPVATRMFLRMMFEHNIVHADLHPGNVLHRWKNSDGTFSSDRKDRSSRAQLVILDPGLVTSLTEVDRSHVFLLMASIITTDGKLAADLLLERAGLCGSTIEANRLDSFQTDMQRVVEGFNPTAGTMKDTKITEFIGSAMDSMRRHSIRVDMNFASFLETLALGDACARVISPNQNIFKEASPFLWNFLKTSDEGVDQLAHKMYTFAVKYATNFVSPSRTASLTHEFQAAAEAAS